MPGWAARRLEDIPIVAGEEADPDWHPLQHHFRLTAFGANVFVASRTGMWLVEEHDEAASGQEELYGVVAGAATFELDGEQVEAPAVPVIAVPEAAVRRGARARQAGTVLLALGGPPRDDFRSTWRAEHFRDVPQL